MAEPQTITVEGKSLPQNAIDPDVKVPPSVTAAAKLAEEIHKQAYAAAQPDIQPDAVAPVEPVTPAAPAASAPDR